MVVKLKFTVIRAGPTPCTGLGDARLVQASYVDPVSSVMAWSDFLEDSVYHRPP